MVLPFIVLGGVAALILYETLFASPKKGKGKGPSSTPPPASHPRWGGLTYVPPTPRPPSASSHPDINPVLLQGPPVPAAPDPATSILQVVQNLLASTSPAPGSMGLLAHQMVRAYLQELQSRPTLQNLNDTITKLRASSLAPEGASAAAALALLQTAFPH